MVTPNDADDCSSPLLIVKIFQGMQSLPETQDGFNAVPVTFKAFNARDLEISFKYVKSALVLELKKLRS